MSNDISLVVSTVVLVLWLVAFVRLWRVRRAEYMLKGGWLLANTGILRRQATYELTHLVKVTIDTGNVINWITGYGTLELEFKDQATATEPEKLVIHGIARGRALTAMKDDLLDLARYLRSNPALKGFIQ